MRPLIRALLVLVLVLPAAGLRADEVTLWNAHWRDIIRATGGPPCPISRAGAMLHAAIYDAVNSIDGTHDPYLVSLPAAPGTSREAAVAGAAHAVLTHLYPAHAADLEVLLATSLDAIPPGAPRAKGLALGQAVAKVIIADRANDATDHEPAYADGTLPGEWRPTPPGFDSPPFNPGWGATKPWTMVEGSQFRPVGPLGFTTLADLLPSAGYADQVKQVQSLGSRTSLDRTPEETEIAWFWANDRNGTYKPPGHLNAITEVISADMGLTLPQNARLFALVNLALGDAGLVAWDAKYRGDIDLWRPVTAIRLADTDGNPATDADPEWLPLLDFTPPFPAWVSGHATFGAAHAAVMEDYFGTDEVEFKITTDEPGFTDVSRKFFRFSDAARENGISRIYLGVHFRFDADDGYTAGTALGHCVARTRLLPLAAGCVGGDVFPDGGDGLVDLADLCHARRALLGGTPITADSCSDLAPGQATCVAPTGATLWSPVPDGSFKPEDVAVLEDLLLGRKSLGCGACGVTAGPVVDLRLPGDIAPSVAPDGDVNMSDVVLALRYALGLDTPSAEQLLRADVAPAAVVDEDTVVEGNGQVSVGDVVLLLRASVDLSNLAWPERHVAVHLDDDAKHVGMAFTLGGWPSWASVSATQSTPCQAPGDSAVLVGDTWRALCVSDPEIQQGPFDVLTITYRAPERLQEDALWVASQMIDADLASLPAPLTLDFN